MRARSVSIKNEVEHQFDSVRSTLRTPVRQHGRTTLRTSVQSACDEDNSDTACAGTSCPVVFYLDREQQPNGLAGRMVSIAGTTLRGSRLTALARMFGLAGYARGPVNVMNVTPTQVDLVPATG